MMRYKRIISILLVTVLFFSACSNATVSNEDNAYKYANDSVTMETIVNTQENGNMEETPIDNNPSGEEVDISIPEFYGIDDPAFLDYIEKNVNEELSDQNSYTVEEVRASYISYEYLEESEYNSKKNIYFGYTLEEIEEQFQDEQYVFTLGEDGTTVVKPFEKYDDTFERIIHNFAVGTGFILIGISVRFIKSSVTGGAPEVVRILFAVASDTYHALIDEFRGEGGIMQILKVAAERWEETKDWEEALKAAVLQLSEEYKWAAIKGVI